MTKGNRVYPRLAACGRFAAIQAAKRQLVTLTFGNNGRDLPSVYLDYRIVEGKRLVSLIVFAPGDSKCSIRFHGRFIVLSLILYVFQLLSHASNKKIKRGRVISFQGQFKMSV